MTTLLFCFLSTFPTTINELPDAFPPMQDSLPGSFIQVDTIMTFDPNTYRETVEVISSVVPLDRYIKKMMLSGKKISFSDTLSVFDFDRYEEKTYVRKTIIPAEHADLFPLLSGDQKFALFHLHSPGKEYSIAKNSALTFVSADPSEIRVSIYDSSRTLLRAGIPLQNSNGLLGISLASLQLTPGTYYFVLEGSGRYWHVHIP